MRTAGTHPWRHLIGSDVAALTVDTGSAGASAAPSGSSPIGTWSDGDGIRNGTPTMPPNSTGDTLVVVLAERVTGTTHNIAGWTADADVEAGGLYHISVWRKVSTGSESFPTITSGPAGNHAKFAFVLSDVSGLAQTVNSVNSGASGRSSFGAISGLTSGELLIAVMLAAAHGNDGIYVWADTPRALDTNDDGWTQPGMIQDSAGLDVQAQVAYLISDGTDIAASDNYWKAHVSTSSVQTMTVILAYE